MNCTYCLEPVLEGEASELIPNLHRECVARLVVGSLSHLRHECGCYVLGSEASDPPEMTLREAANAAADYAAARLGSNP